MLPYSAAPSIRMTPSCLDVMKISPSALDIAEHELALQLGNRTAIGKAVGDCDALVMVVHRHGIDEWILCPPGENVVGQRMDLFHLSARQIDAIVEDAFAPEPAVVAARMDDVDLLDLHVPDFGSEHGSIAVVPGKAMGIAETVGVDFIQGIGIAVRCPWVGGRNSPPESGPHRKKFWYPLSRQVLAEEFDGPAPCQIRGFFAVTRRGIVVETVTGTRVRMHLMVHAVCL